VYDAVANERPVTANAEDPETDNAEELSREQSSATGTRLRMFPLPSHRRRRAFGR
jgi:hypothetical protein